MCSWVQCPWWDLVEQIWFKCSLKRQGQRFHAVEWDWEVSAGALPSCLRCTRCKEFLLVLLGGCMFLLPSLVWQERSRLCWGSVVTIWVFCSCDVSSLGISDLLLLFLTGARFCQKNRRGEADVCGTQEQRKLFRGWLFALRNSLVFRNCFCL